MLLRSESCSMRAARRLESGGSSGSGSRGGTLAEGGRQAGLQEGRKEGKGGGAGSDPILSLLFLLHTKTLLSWTQTFRLPVDHWLETALWGDKHYIPYKW